MKNLVAIEFCVSARLCFAENGLLTADQLT